MAKYLLLRNNKESGPYDLDNLVSKGLKPYDLVWVEGRSAAWRYPSEIEELKPFTPIIEEQPFDRFYKNGSENTTAEKAEETKKYQERTEKEKTDKETKPVLRRKSVVVTLPHDQPKPGSQQSRDQERKEISNLKPVDSPAASTPKTDSIVETKFSQPLDEIKEMYVKTLQHRKTRKIKRAVIISNLKKVSVIAIILSLGLALGLLIRSGSGSNDQNAEESVGLNPNAAIGREVKNELDETANVSSGEFDKKEGKSAEQGNDFVIDRSKEDRNIPPLRIRKETMILQPDRAGQGENSTEKSQNYEDAIGRSRKIRGSLPEENTNRSFHRDNLFEQVAVTSNEYKRVAFGGIRNLQLTVTNNSRFELDNVIVELQYLKPSEQTLRTENIRFSSIPPFESSTLRIPDTNRGIKIVYRIIRVESKFGEDVAAGM